MNKTLTRILVPLLLFVFVTGGWSLLLAGGSRGEEVSPDSLIRLHIVANSDSDADQQLKYRVRDAVTAHLAPRLAAAASIDDARQIVVANRDQILAVARQTITAGGAAYPVALETGWFEFPLRTYGALVLPPGRYESVRILLGDAQGKNWWCVLFPPLCFVDGTTVTAVPALAGKTGAATEERQTVEIRWKIAEILGRP